MPGLNSNTKLLFHFDGQDGGKEIIDSGNTGHIVTQVGTAQLSPTQKKFGSASLLLDGNSDYLTIPSLSGNCDIISDTTEDWTIGFWYNFTTGNPPVNYYFINHGVVFTSQIQMVLQDNGTISFFSNVGNSSENVLAYIKGSEKPDEVLIISAHLDHLGISETGEIYNGADDDGSGTVAIMEIAQAFKQAITEGYGPKRSILFLHLSAEEIGKQGSEYYTQNPVFPIKNTICNLNIDMIGRVDRTHQLDDNYIYLIGADRLSKELHYISEKINSTYFNIYLDYKFNVEGESNNYYSRSDHYNFAKYNIPVIFYFNGEHDDYHKATDTPDKINYRLLEMRSKLIFATAWQLANQENRLALDENNEFLLN